MEVPSPRSGSIWKIPPEAQSLARQGVVPEPGRPEDDDRSMRLDQPSRDVHAIDRGRDDLTGRTVAAGRDERVRMLVYPNVWVLDATPRPLMQMPSGTGTFETVPEQIEILQLVQ